MAQPLATTLIMLIACAVQWDRATAQNFLTPRSERRCTRKCIRDGKLYGEGDSDVCRLTCRFTGGNGSGGRAGCSVTPEIAAGPRADRTGRFNTEYLNERGRDFANLELEYGRSAFCERPDETYRVLFNDAADLIGRKRKIKCKQGGRDAGEVGFALGWVCMGLDLGNGITCANLTRGELRGVSSCYRPFSFSPISFGIDGKIVDGYNEVTGRNENFLDVVALVAPCRQDVFAYAFQTMCKQDS